MRLINCLEMAEIDNLFHLTSVKRSHLLKFRNFGAKTLRELDELMKEYGLEYKQEVELEKSKL